MRLIGDVEGKDVVLVDDLVDTAGTICKAAGLLKEKGATTVRAICTHPVLSGNAYDNIQNSALEELVVTDTIPLKQKTNKIKVLSVSDLLRKPFVRFTIMSRSVLYLSVCNFLFTINQLNQKQS
jgi:ribose-phosphate pyrophosphokinase